MKRQTITVNVGSKEITFETGKIAKQAGGSVVVSSGDTIVFSSACASSEPKEGIDFLPLTVNYQEKFSAAGKTLGGFIKREGRPTERETLLSRLIDRPLRPMMEEGYYHEIQVLTYVWSYDPTCPPDPLALCASAAALMLSDIPLKKAIGAVRVGMIDGQFVINPSIKEQEISTLDLMLAGTEDAILMIEGFCDFLTEEQVIEAIETGHTAIKKICHALIQFQQEHGKKKNLDTLILPPQELAGDVAAVAKPLLGEILKITDKQDRDTKLSEVKEQVMSTLLPEGEENPKYEEPQVAKAFKSFIANEMREMVLSTNIRCDGRSTNEIRFIDIEQGTLPRAHGSSLFTRGETQALAVCTLGGESMGQRYEDLDDDKTREFYLQYFFPPFSVGEVGRSGPAGRREIGHGKLAEKALQSILPEKSDFPYTIRLESNILESNGSSSMASVCGGCLAMMDAGVPVKRPVSGIAMGLILEKEKYAILSDILGIEDALGDMDFKITGDANGITAFQMDIKVEGITTAIMSDALMQAKEGRVHILNKMTEVCSKPSDNLSEYAPRILTMTVRPSKIATIIGPGGKMIRSIVEDTGVEVNINDDGIVSLTSPDGPSIEKAKAIIEGLIAEAEVGKIYQGKIVSIVPFGAFVEILPGKEGLCHISEFSYERINKVEDHAKEGDILEVKCLDIDDRGKIKLSHKATLPKPDRPAQQARKSIQK